MEGPSPLAGAIPARNDGFCEGAERLEVRAVNDQPKQQEFSTARRPERRDAGMTGHNRRIMVPRFGGPEVMALVEDPIPEPGPGQVRVRIITDRKSVV